MKKKILITGACGFIGSHLAEECVKKGYKVIAFDRYNSNYSLGNLTNSKFVNEIEFIFGDIRDYDSVNKVVKRSDIVFHLAALIGIPYSYYSPLAYIRTNVEGTYNVLESVKNNNIEQAIITSTSETYGTAMKVPINEKHRLIGQSPYAASKIGADQLSISYYKSFKLPIKIVRPFNTFGPRQSARAIIPTIITQALNSDKNIKLGNLKSSRDFTYVTDTCSSYFEILKMKKDFGVPLNVGSKNEIKIEQIVKKVLKKLKINKKILVTKDRLRPKQSEVDRLVCDNSLIIKKTNWKPKHTFDKGLELTINWIIDNYSKFKSRNYNI